MATVLRLAAPGGSQESVRATHGSNGHRSTFGAIHGPGDVTGGDKVFSKCIPEAATGAKVRSFGAGLAGQFM